jgi:hypothetical protein
LARVDSRPSLIESPGHVPVRELPRLLLPTLGAMLAAATLFYCLFIFDAPRELFRDSDTGWHIRNGEAILDQAALPKADPYSFSKQREPWIAWEWASDVLMAAAYRMDGLRGVTILFALAIFACTWMCARLQFAAGGDFLLAAGLTPLIVTAASLHWLARPHVLSWLFLLGSLLAAEAYNAHVPQRRRWIHLIAAGLFAAAWANIHGSFILAPLIALVYAVSEWTRPWMGPLESWEKWRRWERMRWFSYLAAVAALGSLVNPYGWNLHAHIFSYLGNQELTARVAEFQSFNFHSSEATQVALAVLLGLAGGLLALSQKRVAHFLLAMLFVWEGLRSARMLPLVALAILPLANVAFTEALQGVGSLRRMLDYSAGLRKIDRKLDGTIFAAVAVSLMLAALSLPGFSNRIGFPPDRFPVAAASALENLPADARLFAPDNFGGYLIYWFHGERKVFFDGRSDFYGVDFMKQYLTLAQARPGWQEIASRYRFTHALVPKDSALRSALEQAGWQILYKDDVATLLESR